jgi:hypothetical protein
MTLPREPTQPWRARKEASVANVRRLGGPSTGHRRHLRDRLNSWSTSAELALARAFSTTAQPGGIGYTYWIKAITVLRPAKIAIKNLATFLEPQRGQTVKIGAQGTCKVAFS